MKEELNKPEVKKLDFNKLEDVNARQHRIEEEEATSSVTIRSRATKKTPEVILGQVVWVEQPEEPPPGQRHKHVYIAMFVCVCVCVCVCVYVCGDAVATRTEAPYVLHAQRPLMCYEASYTRRGHLSATRAEASYLRLYMHIQICIYMYIYIYIYTR